MSAKDERRGARFGNAWHIAMAIAVAVFVTIWVRSYSVSDYFGVETVGRRVRPFVTDPRAWWGKGRIVAGWRAADVRRGRARLGRQWFEDHPLGRRWKWSCHPPDALINLGWADSLGFALRARDREYTASARYRSYDVGFPCWLVASAASLPLLRRGIAAVKRRRRIRAGACPRCGYELRATPSVCPECGPVTGRGSTVSTG